MAEQRKQIERDHPRKVLLALNELRAWDSICDFTIKVENETFTVHSAVIAACSQYFRDFLRNDDQEMQEGIELTGISSFAARQCIEFMYSGKASPTLENVDSILTAAQFFKLEDLTKLCLAHLSENLAAQNCFHVKKLLKKHSYQDMVKTVEEFIVRNLEDAIETNGFLNLCKSEVLEYLQAPNIEYYALWAAIEKWVKFNPNERKTHFLELLSLTMVKLPINFILSTVWPDSLVQSSRSCVNMLIGSIFNDLNKLEDGITIENCFLVRNLCAAHYHANSKQACEQVLLFMMRNFEKIADRPEICSLSKDDIFKIFQSQRTRHSTNVAKWEVAVRWTKFKLYSRKTFFPELLTLVKLENTTADFIQDVVRQEKLVQDSNQCLDIVIDALYALSEKPSSKDNSKKSNIEKTPPDSKKMTTVHVPLFQEPDVILGIKATKRRSAPSSDSDTSNCSSTTTSSESPNQASRKRPRKAVPTKVTFQGEAGTSSDFSNINRNFLIAVLNQNTSKIAGLDILTNHWKPLAKAKVHKNTVNAIVAIDFKLYCLNGRDLFLLDAKDGWKKMAQKLTLPSFGAKMISFENSILVLENDKISSYDIDSNVWIEDKNVKVEDDGFCACSATNFIYILGGKKAPKKARTFDPLSTDLAGISSMMFGRQEAAAVAMMGQVYVLGGIHDTAAVNSVESYDLSSGMWMEVVGMQVPRNGFAACVIKDQIYAVGGDETSGGNGFFQSVEIYEKQNDKYKWRVLHKMSKIDSEISACVIADHYKITDF